MENHFVRGYNIPTCGIVALAFSLCTWAELAAGSSALLFFDYPRRKD